MALASTTLWELNNAATASNVNAGGFNTGNANFLTDYSATSATGNSPVISSATYTFDAGDVGAWVYVKSGTDWTPGFYEITSVAGGAATVDATVGAAVQLSSSTGMYGPSTVAGCATVASPTNGTCGIDYSQLTTADVNGLTDLTCTAASTTVTSASAPFTRAHVGNIIHLTALTGTGAIVGWYEIVNYTDTSNVVLDRTPTNGVNNITAGTFYVGGAMSMNSTLDDELFEVFIGGNAVFIKSGTYTLGELLTVASTSSTGLAPVCMIGYNSVRGDNPASSDNWPTFATGINVLSLGQYFKTSYFKATGTGTTTLAITTGAFAKFIKATNSSTTAARVALSVGTDATVIAVEVVSQNGFGVHNATTTNNKTSGVYAHDCNIGVQSANARQTFFDLLIANCRTTGFSSTTSPIYLKNATIHGWNTPRGTGILMAATIVNNMFFNCLIDGWVTGVDQTTTQQQSNDGDWNNYYNNTTDITRFSKSANDRALNPSYTDVAEIAGSTATTSGSVLTQSGGDFSTVTDSVDYLHVFSGTGVTTGGYLITSHTGTTLTVNNALGTSSAGDVVYIVTTGKDLSIGTNLKGLGYPGTFIGSDTTGYMDIGSVQREEPASGGMIQARVFTGL